MNAISPVINQVLAAQKDALNFRIQMSLEAKQLEIEREKGDLVSELLQATKRSVSPADRGIVFDSFG